MDSLLHIGNDPEAVKIAKESIMEILTVHADQKTIRLALKAFMSSLQCSATVHDCVFNGGMSPSLDVKNKIMEKVYVE